MAEQFRLGESDSLVASKQAWEKALGLLAPEVNRPSFEYFKTAKPVSVDGNTITIGATGELAKIFLEKYSELIKTALEATLGCDIELSFAVVQPESAAPRAAKAKQTEPKPERGVISPVSLPLNDKYVFDCYVVGPCNRLAHAAAKAVAQKPGRTYNPFFIYGGPGLGKTHLLQAIGHYAVMNHPGMQIAYVSGEVFTAHYVTALREHRSEEFRKRYRGIDLWLVDDVQFLAGKERTKEEFFHTFNALYQMDKQVVISSDRAPRDLSPLEERLKSRFESGLVVDIAPPDLETRMAILQSKASSDGMTIPYEVLERVAELIPTNVRSLEGALVTLTAHASLMRVPLTVSLADEVLGRYIAEKRFSEITPDTIQRVVAHHFGLTTEDLRAVSRRRELVIPRHIAMYLSRELTGWSSLAIGKAFGGRNHATVIHACQNLDERLPKDKELRETVDHLRSEIECGRV